MRIALSVIFFFQIFSTQVSANAASLMAQALSHLQKNERTRALKLLELAFEKAVDPESVKESAILILEASSENYPRREAYLRYLTGRAKDNPKAWKWYKELGDRSFDRGEFNQAEEFYLNALTNSASPWMVRYKLAWTYWNQKRRHEAFRHFLDLMNDLSNELESNRASLTEQLSRDMAKLWWEIGPLEAVSLQKLQASNSAFQSQFFSALWTLFPQNEVPQPKLIDHFKQIQTQFPTEWNSFKAQDLYFKSQPCFILEHIFLETDLSQRRTLLACASDAGHPDISFLRRHFEALKGSPDADENFIRAYASLLHEAQLDQEAVTQILDWSAFPMASQELLHFTSRLISSLNEDSFKFIYANLDNERWQKLLAQEDSKILLDRLQKQDPDRWLAYEELHFGSKAPPLEFLMKKLLWLSEKTTERKEELDALIEKVLSRPQNAELKAAKSLILAISSQDSDSLPLFLDANFAEAFENSLAAIDRSVHAYQAISAEWQKILRPRFRDRLQRSLGVLRSKIQNLSLENFETLSIEEKEDFYKRRLKLENELLKKYEGILNESA